jgi:hypothetical protein
MAVRRGRASSVSCACVVVVCRSCCVPWSCVVPGDVSFAVHRRPLPSGVVLHRDVAAGLPIGEGVTWCGTSTAGEQLMVVVSH